MIARTKLEGTFHNNNVNEEYYVIEYVGSGNYLIEFQDEYRHRKVVRGDRILEGRPTNPYFKGLKGYCYLGFGKYEAKSDANLAYKRWTSIIRRLGEPHIFPTYTNCFLCEDWHNFQNFAEWYYNNPNRKDSFKIDKDILVPGNRCYSPDMCAFVPEEINAYFTSKLGDKNPFRGVTEDRHGKFVAKLRNEFGVHRLGYFINPEDAYDCYIRAKDKEGVRLATKWRGEIDQRVYERLMNFNFRESFNQLLTAVNND